MDLFERAADLLFPVIRIFKRGNLVRLEIRAAQLGTRRVHKTLANGCSHHQAAQPAQIPALQGGQIDQREGLGF